MKDERARKVYVQVKVDFSPEGQMRPRELIWVQQYLILPKVLRDMQI